MRRKYDETTLLTPSPAKRSQKCTVKPGITLKITPDFLRSPELQQRAQQLGLTTTALASTFDGFIVSQGGDTIKVNLSYSQAYTYRVQASLGIVTQVKDK